MTGSLIPRTRLFGNPARAQGQISPDGRWLSWLAPEDGVLNIWVAPTGNIGAGRVITGDRKRGSCVKSACISFTIRPIAIAATDDSAIASVSPASASAIK